MRVTEMLVAGYAEDKSMFAVSVVAGRASVLLTNIGDEGETVLSAWQEATQTFEAVRDLVERIVGASPAASS